MTFVCWAFVKPTQAKRIMKSSIPNRWRILHRVHIRMPTVSNAREAKTQMTATSLGPLSCLITSGRIGAEFRLFIVPRIRLQGLCKQSLTATSRGTQSRRTMKKNRHNKITDRWRSHCQTVEVGVPWKGHRTKPSNCSIKQRHTRSFLRVSRG